jgi:hypothetical protein
LLNILSYPSALIGIVEAFLTSVRYPDEELKDASETNCRL